MNHLNLTRHLLLIAAPTLLLCGSRTSAQISAYHGVTGATHQTNYSRLAKGGYRMRSLSLHGTATSPRYTAVWVKQSGPAFVGFHGYTPSQVATFRTTWENKGFRPHLITSVGAGSNIRQAGVWIRDGVPARLWRGLTETALRNKISWALDNGYRLENATVYGGSGAARFAAIFVPNTAKIRWYYGIDNAANYSKRFTVYTGIRVRPVFVAHNGHGIYVSIWHDNRASGGYLTRRSMTGASYQSYYNTYKGNGFYPLMTQGGGSGSSTRYTSIWVKSAAPTAWTFRKTGKYLPKMAAIDSWVESYMKQHKIRGGQLAIARGGRLIHARGYTYAEPGYKSIQPESTFRIASMNKPLTGILALRAVQEGRLSLTTKVWSNLDATTFRDSRTKNITVDHCLTHTGGWDRSTTFDPMFYDPTIASQLKVNLPIDVSDIWQYMSRFKTLQASPGSKTAYSNYGFALVGKVLEKRYGRAYTSLIREKILLPLGLNRPRLGRSILALRAPGEVRYHPSVPSIMTTRLSSSGVWVARQYGGYNHENMEAHGGYIMATADYVKILQALQYGGDRSLLDTTHRDMMWSAKYPSTSSSTRRGWFKTSLPRRGGGTVTTYTHNGLLRGASSVGFHRLDGISVALFFNSDLKNFGATEMQAINTRLNQLSTWPDVDQFPALDIPAFGSTDGIGIGCRGSTGKRPRHVADDPYVGTTTRIELRDAQPSRAATLYLGLSKTQWGKLQLPVHMDFLGAPSCYIRIDLLFPILSFSDAAGRVSIPLALPNDSSLVGTRFFSQFANSDPKANSMGLTTSNAVEHRIGGK